MPKENTTRYIILGLLNHEDLSGYDIKKRIDIMVSHFWNVGYSQIYPTLVGLEREGLVKKTVAVNSKGPQKHRYSITQTGKDCLADWLLLHEEKEYTKYEILLKLFFGGTMSDENNVKRINSFRERHQQNLTMIQRFKVNLENVLDQERDHLYYYITVLFGEHVYGAYLAWADETLKLLNRGTPQNDEEENENEASKA